MLSVFTKFYNKRKWKAAGKIARFFSCFGRAKFCPVSTSQVIWGTEGRTDSTPTPVPPSSASITPVGFVAFVKPEDGPRSGNANFCFQIFSHSQALLNGFSENPPNFSGNRPSTAILFLNKIDPFSLSSSSPLMNIKFFFLFLLFNLIFLFFFYFVIFVLNLISNFIFIFSFIVFIKTKKKKDIRRVGVGVNSFDQFGVELGKILASEIFNQLIGKSPPPSAHDASTSALLSKFFCFKKKKKEISNYKKKEKFDKILIITSQNKVENFLKNKKKIESI